MKGGTIDSIVEKESSNKSEISSAVEGQYENRPIELKKPEPVYVESESAGTDGVYEDSHLRELGISKEKIYDEATGNAGDKKDYQIEESKSENKEEKDGEMSTEEARENMKKVMIESMMKTGDKISYQDRERLDTAMKFNKVWIDYELATSPIRTSDFNFDKYSLN